MSADHPLRRIWQHPGVRALVRLGVVPSFIYLVCFSVLTFPLITRFSSHFFTDKGDGLQNVWNLWWVNQAVTELGQLPWHTEYLHHPWGISLLPHTLNPFNGFLGIGLQTVLTLKQTHNFIVVFAFVVAGLTMFHLARRLVGSYWPSIVAGFIFTFSNYHFAHAEGHMQLVSLEWMPLFLLCWHVLLSRPTLRTAVVAAVALFLVILCDYYYFLYCVITGALMLFWHAWQSRSWRYLIEPTRLRALGVFVAVVLASAGPLVFSLLWLNMHDPLWGQHDPQRASADLLGAIIPGGHWRFAEWTRFYWWRLPGNIHEKSIHLGISVIAVMVWVGLVRRRLRFDVGVWFAVFATFWLLALGPRLQVLGYEISWLRMPYALLETIFPPMEMSGVPVRMMVMTTLVAALVSAAGLDLLIAGTRRQRLLAAAFVVVLVFEYWPRPMPSNPMPIPDHVHFLAALPDDRIIIDRAASHPGALYHQTIHRKRMALGYVSRYPQSIVDNEDRVKRLSRRGQYAPLHSDYGIHYFLKRAEQGHTLVIDTATGRVVFPTEANVSDPTIEVTTRLVEVERLEQHWKVVLEVTFANVGGGVFDLDKATACAGGHVSNHVFEVRQNGESVEYQGMMKKRAPPGPDGFFHIGAGESVVVQVDIGEHYQLPDSGEVTVRFDHFNHFSKQNVQLNSNSVVVPLR